jgi:hypothetical protein
VYASDGALICITVYRKGAAEVVRRLQQALEASPFNMCPDLAKLLPHLRESPYLAER